MEQQINNNELYRSFFNNNCTCMLIIDPVSKKITDANPASCKFYGYDYNTIISMSIYEIHVLPSDAINQIVQEAQSKRKNSFVLKHKLSNGTYMM